MAENNENLPSEPPADVAERAKAKAEPIKTEIEGKKRINVIQNGMEKLLRMFCGTHSFRIEAIVRPSKSNRAESGFSVVLNQYQDEISGKRIYCWLIQFTPSPLLSEALYGPKGLQKLAERFVMKALHGTARGQVRKDVEVRVKEQFERFLRDNPEWTKEFNALIVPAKVKTGFKLPSMLQYSFRDGSIPECLVRIASTEPGLANAYKIADGTGSKLFLVLPGEDGKTVSLTTETFLQVSDIVKASMTLAPEAPAEATQEAQAA